MTSRREFLQIGIAASAWPLATQAALAASFDLPITLYGDGLQVRDLLWVDDLVDAYLAAVARKGEVAGRACRVSGSRMFRHEEPGSKQTSSPP